MSAPPQTDERLFDLAWPGWLPLPPADGLVAFIPDQQAQTAWADKVLGRDAGGFVVWAATGAKPDPGLALVSQRRGVAAISLAAAGEDARWLQVALRLAVRLARETAGRRQPHPVRVTTSAAMPDTASESLRVPHLVTLRTAGNVSEAVVWELLDPSVADEWFGVALPDPALVEAHLPDLLALRTVTRTGQFPADLSPPLVSLLTGLSSPLSIETVYRHQSLLLGTRDRESSGAVA
jgi:hypothetical protein